MSQKTETRFRANKVVPFLKTLWNTKSFPIQQLAIRGDPDFILCCRGRFVALELKADSGRVSPLQAQKLNDVKLKGGVAIVATPQNWESVRKIITNLDKGEYHGNGNQNEVPVDQQL